MGIKQSLELIVGQDYVNDSPSVLGRYLRDASFVPPGYAECVVFPQSTAEVQETARYAHANKLPLVPRSSKVSFYGAGIPARGGIIIDLSRMNHVLEVDPAGKKVKLEAGVTGRR